MTIFIFFAHSVQDYNTEYERLCLEKLEEWYPKDKGYEIINPADIFKMIPKKDIKKGFWYIENTYYFPMILKSELSIVAKCWNDIAWRGRYTPGVRAEIDFARNNYKKILEFSD